MKTYSYREMAKILNYNGFRLERKNGDHHIYIRDGKHISIPYHKNPNKMVFQRLVKENGLDVNVRYRNV